PLAEEQEIESQLLGHDDQVGLHKSQSQSGRRPSQLAGACFPPHLRSGGMSQRARPLVSTWHEISFESCQQSFKGRCAGNRIPELESSEISSRHRVIQAGNLSWPECKSVPSWKCSSNSPWGNFRRRMPGLFTAI